MHIERATDRIWMVYADGGMKFPFSASFVILGSRNALVDTGCGLQTLEQLKERFAIDLVIHSHSHPDHIACSRAFNGRPIWFPEETPEDLHDIDSLARRFMVGEEAACVWKVFVSKLMGLKPPARPVLRYSDGHIFDLGSVTLKAVHTPGHTRDHYCFWMERERILLSADMDLTRFGPWYGHEESSVFDFRDSIRRVKALGPEVILSSHRAPVREAALEALEEYESMFETQRTNLLRHLSEPRSVGELLDASPFYGKGFSPKEIQRSFEEWLIRNLLDDLMSDGLVERSWDPEPRFRSCPGTLVHAASLRGAQ